MNTNDYLPTFTPSVSLLLTLDGHHHSSRDSGTACRAASGNINDQFISIKI